MRTLKSEGLEAPSLPVPLPSGRLPVDSTTTSPTGGDGSPSGVFSSRIMPVGNSLPSHPSFKNFGTHELSANPMLRQAVRPAKRMAVLAKMAVVEHARIGCGIDKGRALPPLSRAAAAPPCRPRAQDIHNCWAWLPHLTGARLTRPGPAYATASTFTAASWRWWAAIARAGGAPSRRAVESIAPGGRPVKIQIRALHYDSGHRFREYQGWDGGGPTPSIFGLLVRPVLFSGAVVVGSLGLAAIYKDEQRRKQGWAWPGQRRPQLAGIDVMGWRFSGNYVYVRTHTHAHTHTHTHTHVTRMIGRGSTRMVSCSFRRCVAKS